MEQYSVIITGLVTNLRDVNFEAGKSVFIDENGILNQSIGNYFGYATSKDSMILRPDFIENPTIKRRYMSEVPINNKVVKINNRTNKVRPLPMNAGEDFNIGGFYHNGYIYFEGYVPNINENIKNGSTYYYDINGDYTIESNLGKNPVLGIGLGNGLYIFERKIT